MTEDVNFFIGNDDNDDNYNEINYNCNNYSNDNNL